MLATHYRIHVFNGTGQTIAVNGVKVKIKRKKRSTTDGSLTYEGSEAEIFNNGSTIANAAYSNGTAQDNTTDKYEGADLRIEITSPASSAGRVDVFLQESTDAGTTYPDNGSGTLLASCYFSGAETKKRQRKL